MVDKCLMKETKKALLQAKLYPRVLAAMKTGATLGLSHGFLLGVMQSDGADFRDDIDVVLMAPKVTFEASFTLPSCFFLRKHQTASCTCHAGNGPLCAAAL